MAAFNFPNSPSVNDLHTENGVTFKWNGTIWNRFGPAYTDTTNLNVTGISTFGGNVSIADKIVHTGDTHTAIRFAGNDIITAEIGGNETLRIDSSGLKITDKLIHTGDTDTFLEFGTNTISLDTAGSERLRIGSAGQLGIAGANYGSSGQVLTSQGGSAAPQWATAAGGGKILQVVQEHKTDTWSESVAQGAKSGAAMTKAITTTSSSNKVLVTLSLTIGWNDQTGRTGVVLKRGGTEIALSDSTGDNKVRLLTCSEMNSSQWCEPIAFTYLDSPGSAASHSYTIHLWHGYQDTFTAYLNRAGYETNHNYRGRGTSSITLMEVSA